MIVSGSSAWKVLIKMLVAFCKAKELDTTWLVKMWFGMRKGDGIMEVSNGGDPGMLTGVVMEVLSGDIKDGRLRTKEVNLAEVVERI